MKPVRHTQQAASANPPASSSRPSALAATGAAPWAGLLDALQEAVWLVDAQDLTLLAANAAAEELLGLPAAALQGQRIESLCVTPEDQLFWSDVAQGAREGLHTETLLRHADGHTLWVDRRICRLPGATPDDPAVWVLSMRDLSAQRRSEEERETLLVDLRSTLESTVDGILVTDLAGRIRNFNQRFATMWGIPTELLQQRDDAAVQAWMRRSVSDGAAYAARLNALLDAPLAQSSEVLRLLDGRVLERVSLPQWSRQRPVGRVFSFRDLSDQLAASIRQRAVGVADFLVEDAQGLLVSDRFADFIGAAAQSGEQLAPDGLSHWIFPVDYLKKCSKASLARCTLSTRVFTSVTTLVRLESALRAPNML